MAISQINTNSLASTVVSPSATTATTATSFTTVVGSAPSYACRSWVNFDGSGSITIRASGNVSSISDNGTGYYSINFATAMSDASYAAVGSQSDDVVPSAGVEVTPSTASFCYVRTKNFSNNTAADGTKVSVSVFR